MGTFFYAATAPTRSSKILDVHKIHLLCGAFKGDFLLQSILTRIDPSVICEESRDAFDHRTYKKQFNSSGIPEFKHLLNCVVNVKCRSELIDNLAKELNFDFGMFKHCLSAEKIGEMSQQGMVIGSHTDSHPVMSRLSRAEQSLKLKGSFD